MSRDKEVEGQHMYTLTPCKQIKNTGPCFIDRIYSFSRESYVADRTGLDSTMLHYQPVQQAMMSMHRPVHSKIMVTYALTWQTDRWRALYAPENGFWSVTKRQGGLFLSFAQTFSVLIVWINCQNGVPLQHGFVYCQLCHYRCGHVNDLSTLN